MILFPHTVECDKHFVEDGRVFTSVGIAAGIDISLEPFYGARKLTRELQNQAHEVGRRHVTTLMRRMGMEAIYRKPRTSIPAPLSAVYPYLLTGLKVERPDHVWAADLSVPQQAA